MEKLTIKQEAFCLEYAQSGNATNAYKKVYRVNSNGTARANAARMLTKANIKIRLKELAKEIATPKIATISEIQAGLTNIFLGKEEETVVSITKEGEIIKGKKPPSMAVRVKAGTELAKMLGAYAYNFNIDARVNSPFEGMSTEQLKKLIGDG